MLIPVSVAWLRILPVTSSPDYPASGTNSIVTSFITQVVHAAPTPAPAPLQHLPNGDLPIVSSYTPGWCGIHLREWKENCPGCHAGEITVNVYDAEQEQISFIKALVDYEHLERSFYPEQRLPKSLTIQLGKDIRFRYGDDKWVAKTGKKGRCTIGKWDRSLGYTTRDMDCGFAC